MGESVGETQLHLRWHSHATTFTCMLSDLHHGRAYTDVSLVCDGGIVRAHRAVLSLCSPYLDAVLSSCPDTEAPLLLPEVPVQDVMYLVSFIYRGQVDVHQQHIASFLRTAKHLHVLGLEQGDRGERVELLKHEISVKEEPSETSEATEEVTNDGRIDLNFYLQQAIQSASMPCPLCKKKNYQIIGAAREPPRDKERKQKREFKL
ncbi:hypothetical protein Pmani_036032 [Petrolisthes manimaculis]|uniref:BTB domain-containing protein n=1 Tax=Petrolisthes manimaculis TaxID=1843537 RepID=A0AAE1NL38_9EUCA|nr:hypothetical protein Pmani_036032 [Petrolisthes manimaculis]